MREPLGDRAGREEDPRAHHRGDDQEDRVVEPELAPQPVARVAVGSFAAQRGRSTQPRNGIISSATMFTSLSIGLMAGPAVSL